MENEAHPRAALLLRDAGWKPHPGWGVYTRGTLVMGGDHLGGFHVKDWGLDLHGPDTPDTPEEAAAWLVHRFAIPADVVTLDYEPEPEQSATHDEPIAPDHGPEVPGGGASADGAGDDLGGADDGAAELGSGGDGFGDVDPIDADYLEANELEDYNELTVPPAKDDWLGSELDDADKEASGAFIFGDNLHQMRTAAIGVVVQIALEKMPPAPDYARFSELRNFTMGVTEGRWADDPAKRDELDGFEAIEALRRRIESIRDEKVAYLVDADREQIEAFDPHEDWP